MSAVDESAVPPAHKAKDAFTKVMDNWDEAAADAAVAGLTRSAGANESYELLFRYGMRDFRSIGHKANYVANSLRTLQCIGWEHANRPDCSRLLIQLFNTDVGVVFATFATFATVPAERKIGRRASLPPEDVLPVRRLGGILSYRQDLRYSSPSCEYRFGCYFPSA